MLADIFYLSAIWLGLSFSLVLLLGVRWRSGNFFFSLMYLHGVLGAGALIAFAWLRVPLDIILVTSGLMLVFGLILIRLLPDWNAPGQSFFLCSLATSFIYLVYAFIVAAFSPLSPIAFIVSFLLFLMEVAALSLSATYAFEVLDVLCRVRWHRQAPPKPLGAYVPWVSLHVPAYNEPPELLEKTLRALAQLDYPNYEVLLVDNNTPDETTWQPLAKVCQELGFKCLHLDRWPGYKSGALNFALTLTDVRAEIIGVIDADYIVQPDYLRRLVPYFEYPQVAFVQAPQDYRLAAGSRPSRFFQAAYDGYKYFFALSMPARNERNASIFCGTMGLLRKKVLQEIGGWDEWCITEDAEASLRILNAGYQSLYVGETFGRGLMPLDFEGLKKQRFRWAFGGVQILKKHWHKLMPWAQWLDPRNRLTGKQRYFYLTSGLQWFNELLTFAFTMMVLGSAVLTMTGHTSYLRPMTEAFVILPLILIGTNLLRALWGLRHALGLSWQRAFYALTLWFSLTWVVALACVQAVIRQRGVSLRTPKTETRTAWVRALQATSLETLLGLLCLLGGVGAILLSPSILSFVLLLLCISQGLIYLSSPGHSLLSVAGAGGRVPVPQADRGEIGRSFANEVRLGLQVGLVAAAILILVMVAALWPAPNRIPWWYSIFNPEPLVIPRQELMRMPPDQTPEFPSGLILPLPKDSSPTPTETPGATSTFGLTPVPNSSPTPGPSSTPASTTAPTSPPANSPPPATPPPTSGATSPPAPTPTPS